jgi:hypothetical protein
VSDTIPAPAFDAEAFYKTVLPESGHFCLVHIPADGAKNRRHLWAHGRDAFCKLAAETVGTDTNWYFGTAAFRNPGTEYSGRTIDNVQARRCFHLDIDAGAEKYKKHPDGAYPTLEDAEKAVLHFCHTTGVCGNLLVRSGAGVHLYCCLTEDVPPDVWKPVAEKLERVCLAHGLKADRACTKDPSRLLRPPGGIHKNGNKVYYLLASQDGVTVPAHSLADFEAKLDEQLARIPAPNALPAPIRPRLPVNDGALAGAPSRSAHDIKQHCALLQAFEATGLPQSEPAWVHALSVVKCTLEGEPLAHEWSAKADCYAPAETQKKLDARKGAHRCEVIAADFEACANCPHRANNGTPLTAGLSRRIPPGVAEKAFIDTLVELDPIAFARKLKDAANLLGVPISAVKAAVKARKAELEGEAAQDEPPFADDEPWTEPVDGAELLAGIGRLIRAHIACEPQTVVAATLWVVFTWFIDAAHVAPIANITAPEKRCGKTQLLTLLGKLACRPLTASNITPAALFRAVEAWRPTLLIDEADAFLKDNEELRGIINSGHTRDSAFVIRTVGDDFTPKRFSTWGCKALCGIGRLAETLADRSIVLELRRKKPDETVARLRHTPDETFETLRRKLSRFAQDNMEAFQRARPNLPAALHDRAQDNWEPLLAVAALAGGEWAQVAQRVAVKISGASDSVASLSTELLADLREIFAQRGESKVRTTDMVSALCSSNFGDSPWATFNRGQCITPRQIAKRLTEFGIKSKPMRIGGTVERGYALTDFTDVFERYLPHRGEEEPDDK